MWAVWVVVAVALLGVELLTTTFFTGFFAISALVAAVVAATGLGLPLQVGAFAVVGVAGLAAARPLLLRATLRRPGLRTGVEAMRGRTGTLTEPILGTEPGLVRLGGETWTARSYFDGQAIPAGTRVEVVEIRGVTAMVMPAPTPTLHPGG